ncbi:NAD(P)-binding protein [Aspergillus homomorphus CBS 101889]|uniref:NAD(P)-binding protein n=1 Tax=Aspergillus homomorphus (strain CBS 101889) TaxID=1450537 RepID=A0A395I8V4_ASPHC|nr:NAD(P)-binding protein [Aspergillus homomorphus CBS 101889]RAL16597.1 NAD(P)-binding protein [Aspergillus homomorphus CBS 101889]
MTPQVIVLAGGTGDFGRYLTEALANSADYAVAILTRSSQPTPHPAHPKITTHQTDYTPASLIQILNTTRATALISIIRCANDDYLLLHNNLLKACLASETCKRLIPSEWAGNTDDFPDLPRSYGLTRAPFRKILHSPVAEGIRWTCINHGWFMDYFLPEGKSYMKYIPGEFPIDPLTWTYHVKGTGEEPQTWTCAQDVAAAVVILLGKGEWEPVTYVAGEWGTFNSAATLLERYYDRPFKREYRTLEQIYHDLEHSPTDSASLNLSLAELEECTVTGAVCCPREKTLRQREEFFSGVRFLGLEEMLERAEKEGCI